jgi:hypothetical protein
MDSKKIFYGFSIFILGASGLSLFLYAYLMPLHPDEAGFWHFYTNQTLRNRFDFHLLYPCHTLTIYLAKVSLLLFGVNGIGFRIPVILFSFLSAAALYVFVNKITASRLTATLATALLFLNPFFLHYSHELRSCPPYFFFAIISYFCLFRLLEKKEGQVRVWGLLFLAFLACYFSNLSAPIFFSVFLATMFLLVVMKNVLYLKIWLGEFEKISLSSLCIFGFLSALSFFFIMFYVDKDLMAKLFSNNLTLNLYPFKIELSNHSAIPNLFSSFFGFLYLNDLSSMLYSYPIFLWVISLCCFGFGWLVFAQNKHWIALAFPILLGFSSLIYILLGTVGTEITVRSLIFLLPLMILFQAVGLNFLTKIIIKQLFLPQRIEKFHYLALTGLLLLYFINFSMGKYKNFDVQSGNPYELAKSYLENSTGPNDLIISNLLETVGGFYFGDLIREKTRNIYESQKLGSIYYLSAENKEGSIPLDLVTQKGYRNEIIPLSHFKEVNVFKNSGVRPSTIYISKLDINSGPLIHIDSKTLSMPTYFTNYGKTCKKTTNEDGLRISCDNLPFSCASQALNFANISKRDIQLVLFRHINDAGNRTVSYASLTPRNINYSTVSIQDNKSLIPDVYGINPLIIDSLNLDVYRRNIDLVDSTFQQMKSGNNVMFCMGGQLFDGNALIKGVTVFNLSF